MEKYSLAFLLLFCGILSHRNAVDGFAVYTHWGRRTCDGGLGQGMLVYTGYVGGSGHSDVGGGSNYMCLPQAPEYGNYDTTVEETWRARVFGGEYELKSTTSNFPFNVPDETPLFQQNAVCAVCAVPSASAVLMIPAKTNCTEGWTREYTGYLVAQRHDDKRTEFVCMDQSPEPAPSNNGDEYAAEMFSSEGVCGSLPCPPYVDGGELACVVCTI